ncbi:MAG: HD domain-containing protein [Clostridia bacterium]|nr:HD domain-containing protein [Clostridia bacterium]
MEWQATYHYLKLIREHSADLFRHSLNVANLALRLAFELGMMDQGWEVLLTGALLHDLGKTKISTAVLTRPGPLSPAEWQQMKKHPAWGAEMLAKEKAAEPLLLDLVLLHHERWDGQGYYGRRGPDLPLLARILILADALDAMTTYRPYQRPRPWERVPEELKTCAGSQFDPELVRVFSERPSWQPQVLASPTGRKRFREEEEAWAECLERLAHPAAAYLAAVQRRRLEVGTRAFLRDGKGEKP